MKTAILITARLKSSRLPKKALRPIVGRPLISHLIDRLRLSERADAIVMCTSTVSEDDPLERLAHDEGVACFRGDPVDVLVRLRDAAQTFDCERVFVCTADNPFVDPVHLDALVDFLVAQRCDYACTKGLPWGAFGWAVTTRALAAACEIKNTRDTEVWGGYFTETGRFQHGVLAADAEVRWPELRLTVDTPEDYELASRICEALYEPGKVFTLTDIVQLCRSSPELVAINAHICQKAPAPIRVKDDALAGTR